MSSQIRDMKLAIAMQSWKQDYENYLASGQSMRDWCLDHNVPTSTFSYRLRKLREHCIKNDSIVPHKITVPSIIPPIEIAKIEMSNSATAVSDELRITKGSVEISIGTSFSPAQLKAILEVVCND